jgi:predicted MFS family arabinose efflux permease
MLTAAGTGIASFAVLMGATAQRVPDKARGIASGIVNAGGSFGQFIFAPLTQKLISAFGWVCAMWSLSAVILLALPMAVALRPGASTSSSSAPHAGREKSSAASVGLRAQLAEAFRDRSYLLLHAGFFTCGFHIAFLVTHLPGEVKLCGLPAQVASWSLAIIGLGNIAGSLLAGWVLRYYRDGQVLFAMYGLRACLIVLYLFAPKTALNYYIFAAGLGLTWLATVPPTAGAIGKLFGARYLATLFGLTLLSHQVGGFLGAWLGGVALAKTGDYTWMWYADIALAATAAILSLPIREKRSTRSLAPV